MAVILQKHIARTVYPMEGGFFDTSKPLRTVLTKKYRKYGDLRHPLLIALCD